MKSSNIFWDKKTRLLWTISLFFGCLLVYSCRTTMSICAVQMGKELGWDKRISGFVMSAFFFGYILTQIFGGMLADRFGGDQIIFVSACIWSIATLLTPFVGRVLMLPHIFGIALAQTLAGVAQGVHFPSLTSLVASRISDEYRNSAYSFAASGTVLGTLVTGFVGSLLLKYCGWKTVFLCFGGVSVVWALMLKVLISFDPLRCNPRLNFTDKEAKYAVDWCKVVTYKSFWALFITCFCESFVFTNLLAWLPTYFKEKYPKNEEWVHNVFPWMATFISSNVCGLVSDKMLTAGTSVTKIRKLFVSLSLFTATALCIALSSAESYNAALVIVTLIICFLGCNNCGIGMNPQDLMPKNAGALYGVVNTAAALSGSAGIYLTGHILHTTKDWSNVFMLISIFASSGGFVFLLFGSGEMIA